MAGPNALDPNLMTPAERLVEVGEILAAGLIRLRARQREAEARQSGESSLDFRPTKACMWRRRGREDGNDGRCARTAGGAARQERGELQQLWRDLYDREPPSLNREFLVKRLACRIQELTHGELSARAEAKMDRLIEEEDRRVKGKQPVRKGDRPIVGTRLIRAWQGVEHTVTVLADGYEYQGRPYKSLSAIARAITGTRWNEPLFFAIRNHTGGR